MQREWQPEELIECWTLLDDDRRLVANKTGLSRLGFALLLKFFELEGRFPRSVAELPAAAVEYAAAQVKVPGSALDALYTGVRVSELVAIRIHRCRPGRLPHADNAGQGREGPLRPVAQRLRGDARAAHRQPMLKARAVPSRDSR